MNTKYIKWFLIGIALSGPVFIGLWFRLSMIFFGLLIGEIVLGAVIATVSTEISETDWKKIPIGAGSMGLLIGSFSEFFVLLIYENLKK